MRMRELGVLAAMLGGVVVALLRRRRAIVAQKTAQSRRFVSRRVVDGDAGQRRACDRWDDDGGAKRGASDALI